MTHGTTSRHTLQQCYHNDSNKSSNFHATTCIDMSMKFGCSRSQNGMKSGKQIKNIRNKWKKLQKSEEDRRNDVKDKQLSLTWLEVYHNFNSCQGVASYYSLSFNHLRWMDIEMVSNQIITVCWFHVISQNNRTIFLFPHYIHASYGLQLYRFSQRKTNPYQHQTKTTTNKSTNNIKNHKIHGKKLSLKKIKSTRCV